MKLTELILELHTIMLEKGNLEVTIFEGCAPCVLINDDCVVVLS